MISKLSCRSVNPIYGCLGPFFFVFSSTYWLLNGENPLFINQWKKTTSMHLSVTLNTGKQIDYKHYSLGIPTEVDEKRRGEEEKEEEDQDEEGGGVPPLLKSRDPHLAGGENMIPRTKKNRVMIHKRIINPIQSWIWVLNVSAIQPFRTESEVIFSYPLFPMVSTIVLVAFSPVFTVFT